MITRRQTLLALAGSVLMIARAFGAQPAARPRLIGFLWERPLDAVSERYSRAFKSGMRELGWQEGRDYTVLWRSAENDVNKLPGLVRDLLAAKVDVIIPSGTPSATSAHSLAPETIVLIVTVADPVGIGLARSLSRPAGNVTGLTAGGADLYPKRLDLLRQIVPRLERVGVLYSPDNAANLQTVQVLAAACEQYKWQLIRAPVKSADMIAGAFDLLKRSRAQGAIVAASSYLLAWRNVIVEGAAAQKIPAVYAQVAFVEIGGLMSYSPKYEDLFRRAAAYADKIFKGSTPGVLPIEQPNTFELIVNLRAAKLLGIKLPDDLLLRADRVIE